MMITLSKTIVGMLFLLIAVSARADILVLVHGWSANANTWLYSGVQQTLDANGWPNAGVVITLPDGRISHIPASTNTAKNKTYRAHLPAEAPLLIQATHLAAELQYINQLHPGESITLAGHSAGGVVARLVVIKSQLPIKSLITIASPNLGTSRAVQGLDIAHDEPFFCPGPGIDFLKNLIGGDSYRYLRHSSGALVDLVPAAPGSLIGWLNQQPHPDIKYHAVIRQRDNIVPAFSQDLNQVQAINGRVKLYTTQSGHALNPGDGILLSQLLNN